MIQMFMVSFKAILSKIGQRQPDRNLTKKSWTHSLNKKRIYVHLRKKVNLTWVEVEYKSL